MPSGTVARQWKAGSRPKSVSLTPAGRIAIVGMGAFGRFCLNAYARTDDLTVVGVADPNRDALNGLDADVRRVGSVDELLRDDTIEVAHVAAPPFVRADVILEALDAGVSVFCEKPLALSLRQADAIIAAARHSSGAVGIDYVMRHHSAFGLLMALARTDLFGTLRTVSLQNFAQSMPPDHWFWDRPRSGGILIEHGVHFFDLYGHVAGRPSRVRARAPRREAIEAVVEYQSGAQGRYYHEFAFPRPVERCTGICFFDRGFIEITGWIPTDMRAAVLGSAQEVRGQMPHGYVASVVEEREATRLHVRFADREYSYREAIMAGMRDLVLRHRDPSHAMLVSLDDARSSLALAVAAQRSADEDRTMRPDTRPAAQ